MLTSATLLICITAVLFSLLPVTSFLSATESRCPNGYHKSPSGDCEKVTHSGGLPRCPDDYHRSPDGDCERVSSVDSNNDERSEGANDDDENNDRVEANIPPPTSGGVLSIGASGYKGSADCFRGVATKMVDGDTIDVNNVRIRLSMVNTPERGEAGYNDSIETTESICPLGSSALVDEDDGQKEGSYDRL